MVTRWGWGAKAMEFPPWMTVRLPAAVTRTELGQRLEVFMRYAPTMKGRGSRTEYFATLLVSWLLCFALLAIGPYFMERQDALAAGREPVMHWFDAIIVFVVAGLPALSAMVRRFHDSGRRWWAIFVVVFPYIGWVILMVILLLNPDPYENEFGPPPD